MIELRICAVCALIHSRHGIRVRFVQRCGKRGFMVTCLRLQGGQAQLWQRHQQRGAHRTLHPLVLLRSFRAVQRARVHPLLLQRHCGKTLWGKHEKDGYIVRVISLSLYGVDMNALFVRRVLICPSHHCALSWSSVDHGDEAHAHGYDFCAPDMDVSYYHYILDVFTSHQCGERAAQNDHGTCGGVV